MNKKNAKRRIMFIQQEDYNFLVYNLVLILLVNRCDSKSASFHDFRKIAYLIEFISTNKIISSFTQDELGDIYSRAQLKKMLLSHVLIVLKRQGIIDISLNVPHQSFDIWINRNKLPSDFFCETLFSNEIKNIKELNSIIKRIRTTTIVKLVDTLFTSKNIITWEV